MERHFYLGANTPYGFYSYYDSLISQKDAKKIYCIKGGPGTGKSSFMKDIAKEMIHKEYDIEFIHCSSDDNSLDGVVIKELGTALVDGTSPHIVDPKNPGATDTILNFSDYWNESGILKNREKIMLCSDLIKDCYSRAYGYLSAAGKIYDAAENEYKKIYDEYDALSFFENVILRKIREYPVAYKKGKKRKLFASAVSPSGMVNRLDTLFEGYETYSLKGYTFNFLSHVADAASARGIDSEMYFCPMNPAVKCEHLIIPKLKTAFSVSNEFHSFKNGKTIDFEIDKKAGDKSYDIININREICKNLFDEALKNIREAKSIHDELESYYVPNMDFASLDAAKIKIINQILEIAN